MGKKPGPPHLRVVNDPKNASRPMSELAQVMKASGLDPKRAAEHGLVAMAPDEVEELLGREHAGIGFIYHQPDGTPIGVGRVRLVEPVPTNKAGKALRYLQPEGSSAKVYLPQGHGLNWQTIAEKGGVAFVVVTEGERKAHAGCAAGAPTVGLGGVWSGAKKVKRGKLLLPPLDSIAKNVGRIVIAFDSDRESNPDVLKAEAALAALMRGAGAEVVIAKIPPAADGSKQGLDDYLLAEGQSKIQKRMRALLEAAAVAVDANTVWVEEQNKVWTNITAGPGYIIDHGQRISLTDFDRKYRAERVYYNAKGNEAIGTEAIVWRTHPARRMYQREVFDPTMKAGPEVLNHYRPLTWPHGTKGKVSLTPFHDVVHSMMTEEEVRWIYSWLAQGLRGARPEWMIYAYGSAGAGKTFLGTLLGAAFMPHFKYFVTERVGGRFNDAVFENQRFVLLDEGSNDEASGRKLRDHLKVLVSSGHMDIEEKYMSLRSIGLHCLIYLATNHELTLHVDDDDRRSMVLNFAKKLDPKLAAKANVWLRGTDANDRITTPRIEVCCALRDYFTSKYRMHSDYNHVMAPDTEARRHLIRHSRTGEDAAIRELMSEGQWLGLVAPEVVQASHLTHHAIANKVGIDEFERNGYAIKLGRKLGKAGCIERAVLVDGKTTWLWAVRNVELWKKRPGKEWAAEYKKMLTAGPKAH